ncbi:hypothetical protein VISI1226_10777 [Vibrio sinaloensis DSM 21326]|uniref:Uncharacterized protein n=1 Tax=Vibrio sinaloensis DSM 21326 TaxID=945550 RepID=E8MAX7_PHOS4|nr:hypothetical protein VISI1226_10777 [Vibrio sinaloensis DSM 21326]
MMKGRKMAERTRFALMGDRIITLFDLYQFKSVKRT